jgi:hypothetical protein
MLRGITLKVINLINLLENLNSLKKIHICLLSFAIVISQQLRCQDIPLGWGLGASRRVYSFLEKFKLFLQIFNKLAHFHRLFCGNQTRLWIW